MFQTESLGKQIKYQRKKAGLTQERLAEILQITVSAISKWESGWTTPDLSMLVRLANLFEVSTDVLLGFELNSLNDEKWYEKIYQLINERKYQQADTLIEKMLLKAPNNFQVVYNSAKIYFLSGMEADPMYYEKALILFRRSLGLISQNNDPQINQAEIKAMIARSLSGLECFDEAIAQLEKINANHQYSALMGSLMMNKKQVTRDELRQAEKHFQASFGRTFQDLIDTLNGFIKVYTMSPFKKYDQALTISRVFLKLLDTLNYKQSINYLSKMQVIVLAEASIVYYLKKDKKHLQETFQQTLQMAQDFDRAPNYSMKDLVFFDLPTDHRVFDSLDESAVTSVEKVIKMSTLTAADQNKLLTQWRELLKAGEISDSN